MEKIAIDLNKKQDALIFKKQSRKVKNQFLSTFQDPSSGLINDGQDTDHKSQHANMFALAFGLIPNKNIDKVVDFEDKSQSEVGEGEYVVLPDVALSRY